MNLAEKICCFAQLHLQQAPVFEDIEFIQVRLASGEYSDAWLMNLKQWRTDGLSGSLNQPAHTDLVLQRITNFCYESFSLTFDTKDRLERVERL
ncbi:hypothetical protein WQ56_16070 [Luteimonas sp. FCS-9]|nr:hypothetical protein WQ56_16070 [Luteimonas sp. FCS-9]